MEHRKNEPGMAAAQSVALLVVLAVFGTWFTLSGPLHWRVDWIPHSGVGIGVYIDDLSLLFGIVVAGMSVLSLHYGAHALVYERTSARGPLSAGVFSGSMLLFTAAMLGLVCAEDLIQVYVCWELTDIASLFLIGLDRQNAQARAAAVKTFLVTTAGGVALLVGLLLLGRIAGTFSIPAVLMQGPALQESPLLSLSLFLIVIGAVSKSGQVPFHVWLPSAMIAPIPVNAFLDSAALLAAGVYVLARLHPIFADLSLWTWLLSVAGVASMVIGGALAVTAKEPKILLAYSTVSQYGFMYVLLGAGGSRALFAALFFWVQHSLIKAGLFFALGPVLYRRGAPSGMMSGGTSRFMGRGGGTAAGVVIAGLLALSLAGILPLSGFRMKELFLRAMIEQHAAALLIVGAGASALTVVYMFRFIAEHFWQEGGGAPAPVSLRLAPAGLALLSVVFGIWPDLLTARAVTPAVSAVVGAAPMPDWSIHFDAALTLSLTAVLLGVVGFVMRGRWLPVSESAMNALGRLDDAYGWMAKSIRQAGHLIRRLQNGVLSRYVFVAICGLLALMAVAVVSDLTGEPILRSLALRSSSEAGSLDGMRALLLGLIGVGTVLTVLLRRHLHVILALGVVGYLIGGLFVLALAPNLGLVQVHVETFVTVLLALGLALIAHEIRERQITGVTTRITIRRALLASMAGAGSAWVAWVAFSYRPESSMVPWFSEKSETLLGSSDVVAAILIHFRALDTLGEMLVFAAATGGVSLLVALITRSRPS